MEIKIYNTLSRRKEKFLPLDGKTVKLYVCGITPYDSVHLGHARCYVAFDAAKRFLARAGFAVRHIQNFTDIDDKIIKRALETDGEDGDTAAKCARIAQKYSAEYLEVAGKLNILPADEYPRVTETVPEIIALVSKLLEKGAAYEAGGDVYFAVRKFAGYGKLSRRAPDELMSGARVAPDEKKADPLDFALWKKSKPGEPSWKSPWGEGRPGWHIECSAMAQKFLGDTIDIHGGGQDLIFPHHENEIAQSEAATGRQFARFFMHNGFVTINKEKMSKSLGNFFAMNDILAKYDPVTVRYFLLSQHYRSPLDFSDAGLEQARHAVERIRNALADAEILARRLDAGAKVNAGSQIIMDSIEKRFDEAMADDFNTAEALAQIHAAVNHVFMINRDVPAGLNKKTVLAATQSIVGMLDVLGINIMARQTIPVEVAALADDRAAARKSKNFKLSDELRDKIKVLGYTVEDTKDGQKLKKIH